MTKLSRLGVKLRCRDQLLTQIRRGIDQKPVLVIGADRNRSLGALKFGMLGSRYPANPTSAIPLRNATARRGAQDDDAQHYPSPGYSNALISKASKVATGIGALPTSGTCHAWRSTCVK